MKRKHKSNKEEARLTIRNASTMPQRMRRNLASWLKNQAALLIREGDQFADLYKSIRTK